MIYNICIVMCTFQIIFYMVSVFFLKLENLTFGQLFQILIYYAAKRNSKKVDFLELGHRNDLFQILQNSQISFIKFRKSAKNHF